MVSSGMNQCTLWMSELVVDGWNVGFGQTRRGVVYIKRLQVGTVKGTRVGLFSFSLNIYITSVIYKYVSLGLLDAL